MLFRSGPGDPAENTEIIETVKTLMEHKIPMFGVCLGHQIAALAVGAKTEKLKYGHRGSNQPVKDKETDRIYITLQNHGYTVDGYTLDSSIGKISHVNTNDGTLAGVRYVKYPCVTVQFHPEVCEGHKDTAYLFDEFVEMMKGERR